MTEKTGGKYEVGQFSRLRSVWCYSSTINSTINNYQVLIIVPVYFEWREEKKRKKCVSVRVSFNIMYLVRDVSAPLLILVVPVYFQKIDLDVSIVLLHIIPVRIKHTVCVIFTDWTELCAVHIREANATLPFSRAQTG